MPGSSEAGCVSSNRDVGCEIDSANSGATLTLLVAIQNGKHVGVATDLALGVAHATVLTDHAIEHRADRPPTPRREGAEHPRQRRCQEEGGEALGGP